MTQQMYQSQTYDSTTASKSRFDKSFLVFKLFPTKDVQTASTSVCRCGWKSFRLKTEHNKLSEHGSRVGLMLKRLNNKCPIHKLRTRPIEKWTKPSWGRYKCNVDASFFEPPDMVDIEICIMDEEWVFVLAWIEWFSPITDVDTGEALGLLKALEWVRDLMNFEVDSKTVADNIYRSYEGLS